jgi:Xaa-Pro aminopeptidase
VAAVDPIAQPNLATRRQRFQGEIGEGVALIPGGRLATRSNDVEYVFRQRSNLLYLTGWEQPEAAALLTKERFTLFVQPRDPDAETWTGRRPGTEGAVNGYGADEAFPFAELGERLPGMLENAPRLYHTFGLDPHLDESVLAALKQVRGRSRTGVTAPAEIVDPCLILHEMRLRKDEQELAIMRAASDISREAHHAAARRCKEGVHEYELEAELAHVFRRRGGSGPAYPAIVGSGDNATILHYIENRDPLKAGDLVLIDAGVELHGYASDVTRVYPVGGRFEGIGRDVYLAVLDAQEKAVRAARPGVTLTEIHDVAVRSLTEALVQLGALEGEVDGLIESEAYKPFYMHTTSHWLGLDVHDVGDYRVEGKPRALEPGMVFTIEPGLYFGRREEKSPEALRGIGVRIEDNVFVTEDSCEVLTRDIPKRIDDVEAWMRA